MTKLKSIRAFAVLAVAGGVAFGGAAQADENAELIVNGEIKLVTKTAAPDHLKDAALFATAVTGNYLNQISFAEFGFGNRDFVILGLFHNIKNS